MFLRGVGAHKMASFNLMNALIQDENTSSKWLMSSPLPILPL